MSNPWFQSYNPKITSESLPEGRLRLYCFHHAGAACQFFQPWANKLPTWIELVAVQLPGRWNRMQEPAFLRIEKLIPVLGTVFEAELKTHQKQVYAFYGHSLGGLVAYELTRFLALQSLQLPAHLFISSKRAPSLPTLGLSTYNLTDQQFEQAITTMYGGLPQEIILEPEIKKMFLDITKKDMELLDTYHYTPEPVLNVPLTVLGGTEDRVITLTELQPWVGLTSANTQILQFPGDHFFLRSPRSETQLLNLISETLFHYRLTLQ